MFESNDLSLPYTTAAIERNEIDPRYARTFNLLEREFYDKMDEHEHSYSQTEIPSIPIEGNLCTAVDSVDDRGYSYAWYVSIERREFAMKFIIHDRGRITDPTPLESKLIDAGVFVSSSYPSGTSKYSPTTLAKNRSERCATITPGFPHSFTDHGAYLTAIAMMNDVIPPSMVKCFTSSELKIREETNGWKARHWVSLPNARIACVDRLENATEAWYIDDTTGEAKYLMYNNAPKFIGVYPPE